MAVQVYRGTDATYFRVTMADQAGDGVDRACRRYIGVASRARPACAGSIGTHRGAANPGDVPRR